jgi:hypothetical protein
MAGMCQGAHLKDPFHLLEGTGSHLRHIKICGIKDSGEKKIICLLRESIKVHNQRGKGKQQGN